MSLRLILIAVVLLGCKGGSDSDRPPTAPDLQIVSAGNEPRGLLRYHLPLGTKQGLEVAIDLELVAGEMGGPLPTLVMSLLVAVEGVGPDGGMRLHSSVIDVTARDRDETRVPPEALTGPLDAMKGVAFVATLSPHGRLGKAVLEGNKQLSEPVNAQLTALTSSFDQAMMPLPDDPVGVGAVWRNSRAIEHNGMKMIAVNTVALTAIDGDKVSFTLDTDIHGDDQTVRQGSASIDIKDITGQGSGTGTFELGSLKINSELTAEFRSEMSAPGETQPTPMKMVSVVRMTSR